MKKELQSPSSLWVLFLSYAALFVLLVVLKNIQFWNMREKSAILVEEVSNSLSHRSAFLNSYNDNIREQNSVLELLYSSPSQKNQKAGEIISEIKRNDSLLAINATLVQGAEEQAAAHRLLSISNLKNNNLTSLLNLISQDRYEEAISQYNRNLFGLYRQFQMVNAKLLNNANQFDNQQIKDTQTQISNLSRSNFWISGVLVIVMISLGINLIKIGKLNKRTTEDLKESERKYRTLTEQTNEIIKKCDANGKFLFANDSFKKRLEYSDEELAELSCTDILDDENKDLPDFPKEGEKVFTHVEKIFKSKSGRKIYLEGNVIAEYRNGVFAGTTGFFNDVTEKKQLEESLIASELKFRTFFNVAPIPMWAFDPVTYKFVLVNKAALNQYGFTEEEFLNKTVADIRGENDLSVLRNAILKMEEDMDNPYQNVTYQYKGNHYKKSGDKIDVEIYTSPIIIDEKKCILTIALDVTERNHYENNITKAIIKTQEDERYEIGAELHDNVCQILAAVKMNLSRLKPALNSSVMDLYCQSSDGIRMATDEIRNLSHRLAPAFFENTTLEEMFEGLLKNFNMKDTCNTLMYFDNCAKKYPLSQEIRLNLYRILQEQLRNIIKHANCSSIKIGVFIQNHKLTMRIADNGKGFDLGQVKGGIGLANMKRRSELFSGKMSINSTPGYGCELLISIPV